LPIRIMGRRIRICRCWREGKSSPQRTQRARRGLTQRLLFPQRLSSPNDCHPERSEGPASRPGNSRSFGYARSLRSVAPPQDDNRNNSGEWQGPRRILRNHFGGPSCGGKQSLGLWICVESFCPGEVGLNWWETPSNPSLGRNRSLVQSPTRSSLAAKKRPSWSRQTS